jgi:plasmid stabilization system protein ParE
MSRRREYAAWFDADIQLRAAWYTNKGGQGLALRFIDALETTVDKLELNPSRGRQAFPKDPRLADLHAMFLERPFQRLILFYRFTEQAIILERLIHGARDLPRRIGESPTE